MEQTWCGSGNLHHLCPDCATHWILPITPPIQPSSDLARLQSLLYHLQDSSDVYTADWGQPDKMRKMKVALHVGYDGSSFRGT